jgi:hypothetical protein
LNWKPTSGGFFFVNYHCAARAPRRHGGGLAGGPAGCNPPHLDHGWAAADDLPVVSHCVDGATD